MTRTGQFSLAGRLRVARACRVNACIESDRAGICSGIMGQRTRPSTVGQAGALSWATRLLRWGFHRHVRRFIRRNFHAVRAIGLEHVRSLPDGPAIGFLNHPGWWDPMTGVLMTDLLFPGRRFFAPMDAEALSRYPLLGRLGFFPVERDSVAGTKSFLRNCRELLTSPTTLLWLTPGGRFSDVREPVEFQAGISHLIHRGFCGGAFAMAVEYPFWSERYPELLVAFSAGVDSRALPENRDDRTRALESVLAATQAALAERAIARDPRAFTTLATGGTGVGGCYDFCRRIVAGLRGRTFHPQHESADLAHHRAWGGEPS